MEDELNNDIFIAKTWSPVYVILIFLVLGIAFTGYMQLCLRKEGEIRIRN